MSDRKPKTIYLSDYRPSPYLIDRVDIHFDLDEQIVTVTSILFCSQNKVVPGHAPLVLNGRDLELVSVSLDKRSLRPDEYRLTEESLIITNTPDAFTLEVVTRIRPQDNTSLEGLYKSSGNFCTQCEAQGFRKITYFIDRPDVMAHYDVTIAADRNKFPILLANGNLVGSGELSANKHYAKWHDPFPKPSYLFALVAGDLSLIEDSYVTRSGRQVTLQIYVEHHNRHKCDHAMQSLKKAMQWDEDVFGLEYDLERYMIVAVDDFNMGAMENKGLNVFNSKYVLARPETATDSDYEGIEAVVGHEYFHNWTGNRVTCRDWFQLSLKEGLTVFRDQEFSGDISSRAVKRIRDVQLLRNKQFPEDAGPMSHPVRPESYIEINNFYTLTVYEKGSEIIRMVHTILGRAGFVKGMLLYIKRFDGKAATTDDFMQAMEDANEVDLSQFRLWYSQAGTPEVHVSDSYDPKAKIYTLNVQQSFSAKPDQPAKKCVHIPLSIALFDENGLQMKLQVEGEKEIEPTNARILKVNQKAQSFRFVKVASRPVPSLLRNFSAPVKLHYPYSQKDLRLLLAHDTDPFNRWEAWQRLSLEVMFPLISTWQEGEKLVVDPAFISTFETILSDSSLSDNSFKTLLLTLPSEDYLGEMMDEIDVDAVHGVREFIMATLAEQLQDIFLAVYHADNDRSEYSFDPDSVGRRRLKNLCLSYLVKLGKQEFTKLCLTQYREANNMTDRLGAFRILAHTDCPERREVLDDFYSQWREDVLVMDKWFSIQAAAPLSGTLEEVKKLMEHPLFSIVNPNRVRALIGSFCAGNPVCFHDKSGAGYAFLADFVLSLDAVNPQIASRMLQNMSRWRRYDAPRKKTMKKELERIAGNFKLSKDVYEVAAKSLA